MGRLTELPFFPTREPTDAQGGFLTEPLTRRSFLNRAGRVGAGVLLGTTLALYTDTKIGDRIWGGTSPETGVLHDQQAADKFPHTWTLVIGGYNVDDPDKLAESISPAMSQYSQIGYLRPSNEGLQMSDMKRAAEKFVEDNKVENLYVYGHSMGGMVGTELGAHLAGAGVNVQAIIYDCSPLNYEDIYEVQRGGANMLISAESIRLRGGPATRFGIEVLSRWRDGRRDVVQMCADAIKEISPEGCSNKLIQSQASYMSTFRVEDYIDSFAEATRFIYLTPDNVLADATIDNTKASKRLQRNFPNNAVLVEQVIGGGHANPRNCIQGYQDALLKVAYRGNFPDGRPPYKSGYLGHEALQ